MSNPGSISKLVLAALCGAATLPAQVVTPASPGVVTVPASAPAAAQTPATGATQTLTLQQAEQIALRNNPTIASARLLALAEGEQVRQARAGDLPLVTGNLTAVEPHENSRITAGALNNPTVYERAAGGVTLSQLITDFGHTHSLIESAEERTRAEQSNAAATADAVVLAVDDAFYRALGSEELVRVAQQTVATRQATTDQVQALASAGLRSTLDLNFAQVNLSQAKLLLLDAQDRTQAALDDLSALLGESTPAGYTLVRETAAPQLPPQDAEPLIAQALQSRPDLRALNLQASAEQSIANAERDLNRPTVAALGAVGGTPVRADQILSSWYGAVGANISIPIFNGGLYSSRAKEATLRAQSVSARELQLRDNIARDVRSSVLQARNNYERITVAAQQEAEAASALRLAQTRYQLGLSSIVELSQAQLAETQAQIDQANALYSFQGSLAAIRFETGQ